MGQGMTGAGAGQGGASIGVAADAGTQQAIAAAIQPHGAFAMMARPILIDRTYGESAL